MRVVLQDFCNSEKEEREDLSVEVENEAMTGCWFY